VSAGDRPDTVLVNLLWLVPGVVGGSEESVTDALRAVAAACPGDLRLRLAVLRPFLDAHPDLVEAFPTDVAELDGANKVRRVLTEQTWLASLARRVGADVVHHAGGTVPFVHPGAVVLTIQDLQPLDLPGNFSWVKRTYLRAMLGRSARAARVVCVPSEFTRSRVVELLGVTPEKVQVVPWTPRPAPAHGAATAAGAQVPAGPFLLYPAITYPHKNHLVLVEAFARLEGPARAATLVLTGGSAATEDEVMARVDALGLRDRVLRTGGSTGPPRGPVRSSHGGGRALALRGIRPAGPRGHGPRLPGRGGAIGVAARGRPTGGPGGSRRCDSVGGRHAVCPGAVGPRPFGPHRRRAPLRRPVHPGSDRRRPDRGLPGGPPPPMNRLLP
jgi:glycosyltransferase involved in cell wall biosynthesis